MIASRRSLLFLGVLLSAALIPRTALAQGFKVIRVAAQEDAGPHTLIQNPIDGLFYGTCQTGGDHSPNGCVFKMDATGVVTIIHSFAGAPSDGGRPVTALFFHEDGLLYGTTTRGGANDQGTVFKLDASGGSYAFASQPAPCASTGADPEASLFEANDGSLYLPLAACGNTAEVGTVDRVDTSLSETRIAGFNGLTSPLLSPHGHLIQGADDKLYGTALGNTNIPGKHGGVYRVALGGGLVETVHSFANGEGNNTTVSAPLLLASDGNFWGTTKLATNSSGASVNTGTIFRVAADGTFQTMHTFTGPDGRLPVTGLIEAADGYLYGTTLQGGTLNRGVIFRIDLSGNFTLLANVADAGMGLGPWSELLEASDGKLYGTTQIGGGLFGFGTTYTIDFTESIADIVPNSGPSAGGTPVTIDGTGFISGASAFFGLTRATAVSVVGSTHINATTPAGDPGTIVNVKVTLPDTTVILLNDGWMYDFLDLPTGALFHDDVRTLLANGITAGCGGGDYCPAAPVLRKQMAVFVLKSKYGSSYQPPPATGIFTDVPASDPFAPWIEALYHLGVVAGCGPGPTYCPDDAVLRQQMPVFLLKTLLGSAYVPRHCTGVFADVPCPSLFADWIEDVAFRGIAAGCGGGNFCPGNPTTRGQMAPFLVKTFSLP
ncbi:MAG TPA: choice-of-anchor tandem repeat GloVer-containing protein [Thermoanaerobaculia bacterium]|nr:choice-of-anchor tandem repeat GloVer-containing protein [Thermoanaerobaculia bacterium]